MGHSPRTSNQIHMTPSDNKKKFSNDSSYGNRSIVTTKAPLIRDAQHSNNNGGGNFFADQKAKRNRSSELISGYYKINRAKLPKKNYGISG